MIYKHLIKRNIFNIFNQKYQKNFTNSTKLNQELQKLMIEIIELRQQFEKNKKENLSLQEEINQKEKKKEQILSELVHNILIEIQSTVKAHKSN